MKIRVTPLAIAAALYTLTACGVKQKDMELKKMPGHVEQPVEELPKQIVEATLTNGETNVTNEATVDKKIITDSGLMFEILKDDSEKDAQNPLKGNQVKVHYTGWLADEDGQPDLTSKFDSSVDRNDPFVFPVGVGMVIRGWDEGVLRMKVGQKVRMTLPSDIAYGARGAGRAIPPHATLVFDVELLDILG